MSGKVFVLQTISYGHTRPDFKSDQYESVLKEEGPYKISRPAVFDSFEAARKHAESKLHIPDGDMSWECVSEDGRETFRAICSSAAYGGLGSDWVIFVNVSVEPVRKYQRPALNQRTHHEPR